MSFMECDILAIPLFHFVYRLSLWFVMMRPVNEEQCRYTADLRLCFRICKNRFFHDITQFVN